MSKSLASTELRLKAAFIDRGCDYETEDKVKFTVEHARTLARNAHVPKDRYDEVVVKILEAIS